MITTQEVEMTRAEAVGDIEHSILAASKIMVNILAESLIHEGHENVTVAQFRILDMIYNGTDTPTEIAKMLDVSPPAITVLLEKLEGKSFLTRLTNTDDRRRVALILTPDGIDLVENVNDYRAKYLQKVLKKMGRDRATQLQESLAAFNLGYSKLKSKTVDSFAGRDIKRLDSRQKAAKQ
jgi:DNA-binding MarR family transcriptional regulator